MVKVSGGRRRGTIKQRGQGWEVRVYAGLDPVIGEWRYLYGTKPTEAEAKRLRNKFVSEIDAGRVAETRVTVGQRSHEEQPRNVEIEFAGWTCGSRMG